MGVRVGTAGWSYDDWQGAVYPAGLAASDRLAFYAERLSIVEVDATFYRDPAPAVVNGWMTKTNKLPRFELCPKAPQPLTQDAMALAAPADVADMTREWSQRVARPLARGHRLGVVLLQLSPGILHNRETLARLDAALAALAPIQAAVEFRNKTWHDAGRLREDAVATLDAHDAAAVIVDGPSFPFIVAGSASHAYVRLHGRNAQRWHAPRAHVPPGDRYDYRYASDELAPIAREVTTLAREKDVVRVIFNNHVRGKAFENAVEFESLLVQEGAPLVRLDSPQRRLPV